MHQPGALLVSAGAACLQPAALPLYFFIVGYALLCVAALDLRSTMSGAACLPPARSPAPPQKTTLLPQPAQVCLHESLQARWGWEGVKGGRGGGGGCRSQPALAPRPCLPAPLSTPALPLAGTRSPPARLCGPSEGPASLLTWLWARAGSGLCSIPMPAAHEPEADGPSRPRPGGCLA